MICHEQLSFLTYGKRKKLILNDREIHKMDQM